MLPILHSTNQAKRFAARFGLHFHIDRYGDLTTHNGYESGSRLATGPELQLWRNLASKEECQILASEEGTLETLPDEVAVTLYAKQGPVYMNAVDVAVLRQLEGFIPQHDREQLQDGLIGVFENAAIYISRAIPKGYVYFTGSRVEALHKAPVPEQTVENIVYEVEPLMTDAYIKESYVKEKAKLRALP